MEERCPFVGCECSGGTVDGGWVGCAYKDRPESECEWAAELPHGTSPRDFYNATVMEATI